MKALRGSSMGKGFSLHLLRSEEFIYIFIYSRVVSITTPSPLPPPRPAAGGLPKKIQNPV